MTTRTCRWSNANEAWTAVGGEANAGAGVKVAIIDSGIDVTHPCFDDAGYPAQTQLGDPDSHQQQGDRRQGLRNKHPPRTASTPTAVNAHGTHVAGTVACNAHTPAVIDGVDIPYDPSGVAPRALLGNYNVFPGETGRPAPRTSSTRSRRPMPTGSTSPT